MVEGFYDFFDPERIGPKPDDPSWGILSKGELSATREFEKRLASVLDDPIFDQGLDVFLASKQFYELSAAASICLRAFDARGKLDEEKEDWR
ncbi:hypothetical protein RA29_15330 [Tateyamaria sp. ANG-S1]|nr:hypothetical protein RA29_15330 [Tateyamaria sp. ANG-S1]